MEPEHKSTDQKADELAELRRQFADLDRRHQAVCRIASALNTDQPMEEIMRRMGGILQDLIPCDRLSLGLLLLSRWYLLQDGRLTSANFLLHDPVKEEERSASRWVVLNRRPLL